MPLNSYGVNILPAIVIGNFHIIAALEQEKTTSYFVIFTIACLLAVFCRLLYQGANGFLQTCTQKLDQSPSSNERLYSRSWKAMLDFVSYEKIVILRVPNRDHTTL